MNGMTKEELISTFGEEVGNQMHEQMNASSGGSGAPFTFLKKISDHDSELGNWGDHVIGIKTEKNDDGVKVITDKGTNLGASFDIFVVNVGYQYSRWDDVKERSETSNSFTDIVSGIKGAVNSFTGEPLPASKEAKKEKDWKMNKVMGVLVRKDAKSPWTAAIYEISGKTYFTFGELTNNKPNKGLMDGIYTLKFLKEKKGSTTFTVIDTEKSKFEKTPAGFFGDEDVRTLAGEITTKMTDYRQTQQYSGTAKEGTPVEGGAEGHDQDETNW